MPAPVLIIAYGNPLRCDDGVAWHAADALENRLPQSDVEIIRLHQLAPEVADALRDRDLAIFLDAAYADDLKGRAGEIRVYEISGEERGQKAPGHFTHVYSPARVLELARALYGVDPKALAITFMGQNFRHGESLSPAVAGALPRLIEKIEREIKESLSKALTTKDTK